MVSLSVGTTPLSSSPVRRFTPQVAALLLLASVGWALTFGRSRDMGGAIPGTMGLALPSFLVMWTPMMAAMMLPAVAPLAAVYVRTVKARRGTRLTGFAGGYVLVWAAAGIPAFAVARLADRLAAGRPAVATGAAVTAYALCGLYQLTPWKDRCLRQCRSPMSLLLRYGSYSGRFRDLAAGAHHGAYCGGCCWALFVVLIAVGVMNIPAMLILAGTVTVEKLWSHGIGFARVVGAVALVLAAAVVWVPSLAPGLIGSPTGPQMVMNR